MLKYFVIYHSSGQELPKAGTAEHLQEQRPIYFFSSAAEAEKLAVKWLKGNPACSILIGEIKHMDKIGLAVPPIERTQIV